MERVHLAILAGLATFLLVINAVSGCTCPNEHPQQQVCKADFVVRGDILKKDTKVIEGLFPYTEIRYTVKVKRIYKGEEFMPEKSKIVYIYTIEDSYGYLCGATELKKGSRYLLSALYTDDTARLVTRSCLWNVEWSEIRQGQKQGLKHFYSRYCQKCDIVLNEDTRVSMFQGNALRPAKPAYCSYDGGECEKLHSSCIRKQSGACGWTTNTNYRSCTIQKDIERLSS